MQFFLTGQPGGSGAGALISSLVLPLLAVVAMTVLAYAFTRWLSKKYRAMSAGKHLKVIERQPLGKDRELLMISVGGRAYVLGVTAHAVNAVCSFDVSDLPPREEPASVQFGGVLKSVLRRGGIVSKDSAHEERDRG